MRITILCLVFNLILPLMLFAAPAEIAKTGQVTSYAAGDDGDLQAGVSLTNQRFLQVGDGTIKDNLTGLIWSQNASTETVGICTGGARTWQGALDYVACLNDQNHLGYNDWILPNINELKSLIDIENSNPVLPSTHPFIDAQLDGYWSSSTSARNVDYAWSVSMDHGYVGRHLKANSYYNILPVREERSQSSLNLPKTGQIVSYESNDDGAMKRGGAWPSPRFIDNSDGTVTDSLTGLIWLRNANCFNTQTWSVAVTSANSLMSGNCGLTDGSVAGDWKLSNRRELESLFDLGSESSFVPEDNPFTDVQDTYWSSSSYASGTGTAWHVNMNNGIVNLNGKTNGLYYAWPVRREMTTDADSDGILDVTDNCISIPNPSQSDNNHNGIGDACDSISAVSDFNYDGISDVLYQSGDDGRLLIWEMNNFARTVKFPQSLANSWDVVGKGDFNGDGTADVLYMKDDGTTAIAEMTNAARSKLTFPGGINPVWKVNGIGDFNGDGTHDILWRRSTDGVTMVWGIVNSARNKVSWPGGLASFWDVVGIGDFDNDGIDDILCQHNEDGRLLIWKMENHGRASVKLPQSFASTWIVVGIGDFNADGTDDVLYRKDTGDTAIAELTALNRSAIKFPGGIGLPWSVKDVGDYDGDGTDDIFFRRASDGVTLVWGINSSGRFKVAWPGGLAAQWIVQGDGIAGNCSGSGHNCTSNNAPVANAGDDQNVKVNSTVTLDGSDSSDADSDPLTYLWTFSSKPSGSEATLSDETSVNPMFTPDLEGDYVLTLVVNDGLASSNIDTVLINARIDTSPTPNAGPDQTVALGSTVFLDGSSSFDADGDSINYEWNFVSKPGSGNESIQGKFEVSASFTALQVGTYVMSLTVYNDDSPHFTDMVSITVEPPPPVVVEYSSNTGIEADLCLFTGDSSLGGYTYYFENCNIYGYPGTPIYFRVTNNTDGSISIDNALINFPTTVNVNLGFAPGSEIVNARSSSTYSIYLDMFRQLNDSTVTFSFDGLSDVSADWQLSFGN